MAMQPTPWTPPQSERAADRPLAGGDVFIPASGRQAREEQRDTTRLDVTLEDAARAKRDETYKRLDTYRQEFLRNPTVTQFREVEAATRQMVQLANREPDPATDIAMVISYMKALDPGSVVREGEFATASNSAAVPDIIRNYYNRLMSGERLTPEQRKAFASTAISLYDARRPVYDEYANTYRGLITEAGGDPEKQGIRIAGEIALPTAPPTNGSPISDYKIVTPEESAAIFGEAMYDQNGNPVGEDYNGDALYDAQGNFVSVNVRITDETPIKDPREEMGMLGALGETITGSARSTPEVEALPDWTSLPELGSVDGNAFLASLATLTTGPEETARIITSQFPGVRARSDEKGNIIFRSAADGKEYAFKPGFRMSDIPRAAGAVAAFAPAGRAATAGGAFLANAGTQAALETAQAATGGEFNADEVLLAGAAGTAGQQLARGLGAARRAITAPEPVPPPRPGPLPDSPPPVPPEQMAEVGEIARQAIGKGEASRNAQARLAIMAQVDPEVKAAAERLGMELPLDVLSNDARLLTTTGLARSQIGSDAQAAWGQAVSKAIEKSDDALRAIGATRSLADVSEGVRQRLIKDMDDLKSQADALRTQVDEVIDVRARAETPSLQSALAERINDLGGLKEAKQAFTAEERKLLAMLGEGETAAKPTYARLNQIRDDIGRALNKGQGPWVDTPQAALKRYYGALADDQIAHIEAVGGKQIADKMRGSNDLYSQMFKARETMKTVYGKSLERDIGPLIRRSLTSGQKGDGEALRKLIAAVPEDMRSESLLSGIFSQTERSGANGGFSFTRYADMYRGLRDNSPIYAEIARTIGPDAERVLRDLYSISRRVAAAEAKIVRTGASNQPLLNALNAEGLVSRVAKSAAKRAVVTGGTAAGGGLAGGPMGAAMGAGLAEALQQSAATAGKTNLDRLHGVLNSESFKTLVERVADGSVREEDIIRAANEGPFRRYAKSVLGITEDAARRSWMKGATTAGATTQMQPEPNQSSVIEVR